MCAVLTSIFLSLEIELRLINQLPSGTNRYFREVEHTFSNLQDGYGLPDFATFLEINDPQKGYYVNDMIILEAYVRLI